MANFTSPLNNLKIASPCSQDWNAMIGDERKRYCGECKLNVYNLSGMNKTEAENLIMNAEGRLCVRFYKRSDGTVLTQNCPVGWAKVKQRAKVSVTAAFSLIFSLVSGLLIVSGFRKEKENNGRDILMGAVAIETNSNVNVRPTPVPMMGNIAPIQSPTPKVRKVKDEVDESEFMMGKMVVPVNKN